VDNFAKAFNIYIYIYSSHIIVAQVKPFQCTDFGKFSTDTNLHCSLIYQDVTKNQFVLHTEHNAIRLKRGLVLFVLRNKETQIHGLPYCIQC